MASDGDTLEPGVLVGDYLVERCHATGGYATVYHSVHLPTGRPAALKLLHRFLSTSPRALRRFQREVEVVGRLNHPNIVRALGFGEHIDGRPYLATEWLSGRTLTEELQEQKRFSIASAARAVCQLCLPLQLTHDVGVVHRDLKASNVIAVPYDDWYRMILVDFGIAKLLDPELEGQATTVGVHLGSPHAMAPEQIRGDPIDARTDIYALGILLYQLVTGQLPFQASSAAELEELQLSEHPLAPSQLCSAAAPLDPLIMACLNKEPNRRPPHVTVVREALLAYAR